MHCAAALVLQTQMPGVAQAMKKWQGKKFAPEKFFQLPQLLQFPPTTFMPSSSDCACYKHDQRTSDSHAFNWFL